MERTAELESKKFVLYLWHMSVLSFTGPEDEVDLILCRSGIFTRSEKGNAMTICPLHRAKLGLGWTRGAIPRCLSLIHI